MRLDSLQRFDESGEEVGHSAAHLRAVVSQSSLVQKRHLTVNTTPVSQSEVRFTTHTVTDKDRHPHQNPGDVLRLHDEELIVSDHRFEELQRHRGVLVAAHVAGHQLRIQSRRHVLTQRSQTQQILSESPD